MPTYGVTSAGFELKRLADILSDMVTALNSVVDPVTGETLTPDLQDENDPFVQQIQAIADSVSLCWEQLQLVYNQFDPLQATGAALSGLVQLNGLERILGETDSELRVRQQECTTAASRGMIEDCYAAVKALTGVTFCRIYQNTMDHANSDGIPARSLAAVVLGGDATDITTVLFNHASLCNLYGNVQLPYIDIQGVEYLIGFTRPIIVPIYVSVSCVLVNASLWPSDGADQIKNAIVQYAAYGASAVGITTGYDQVGLVPGASVYATDLVIPVSSVPGIRILAIKIGAAPDPRNTIAPIAWNEQASILAANIEVTV